MTFMPRMTAETRAMRTLRPLSWRRWQGVVADVWHVHIDAGGGGYYRSPDPRLVVFLNRGAEGMRLRHREGQAWRSGVGALFVPADLPLWSDIPEPQDYVHLDLHLEQSALAQRLRPFGADDLMTTPRFLDPDPQITQIASLIAADVERPRRPDMALDGLLSALLAEVFDLAPDRNVEALRGGLSPHTVHRVRRHALAHLHRRIPVSELAEVTGLSESWLTRAFRQSLGTTPQRWLTALRLEAACTMMEDPAKSLAEIALATGFADQAHLTRSFRAKHGLPPGDWRRRVFGSNSSKQTGLVQERAGIPT